MSNHNSIARTETLLPGVATADDLLRLAASFSIEEPGQGKAALLDRLPTSAERKLLQERNHQLLSLLRPAGQAMANQEKSMAALSLMFAGFPSMAKTDVADLLNAYWSHLCGLPLIAIVAACEAVTNGTIKNDVNWPPASPRLHTWASRAVVAPLSTERQRIERILTARGIMRANVPPEAAERIKAGLVDLVNQLSAGNGEAAAEDRDCAASASRVSSDRAILVEYARRGVEPRYYGDGRLISPWLIEKYGVLR